MSVPATGYWSTQGIALAFKINTSFMLVCAKACATISENTKTWKSRQALYTEQIWFGASQIPACLRCVSWQHVRSARLGFGLGSLFIWIGEELISKLIVQEMNSFQINYFSSVNKNNSREKKLSDSASHYESCTSKNWHTEPDNLPWRQNRIWSNTLVENRDKMFRA